MNVLVTGATGFVGSHLTSTLVKQGNKVRVLARSSSNTTLLESQGVEICRGEITDAAAVEHAMKDCQQVYHLAAKMVAPKTPRSLYYKANVVGTQTVAQAALKAKVERLVYASSAGVYGVIKHPPVTEMTSLNPSSGYRETKFLAEQAVLSLHRQEGLPSVIIRLPGVFGPGSLSLLGLVKAIASGQFRMIGTGENHDHLGYVSDVVDALQRCAQTQGIEGECYLIAGAESVKVKDLTRMIAQELGVSSAFGQLPIAPYRAFNGLAEAVYQQFKFDLPRIHRYALFLADKVLDLSKAKTQLGYCPTVSVEEGIRQTVQWYCEQGYVQISPRHLSNKHYL